jgi:hypothetical protein
MTASNREPAFSTLAPEQGAKYTAAELRAFDKLSARLSSHNQATRIEARFKMRDFVEQHGKDKCDAMFAEVMRRDNIRRKGTTPKY